MIARPSTPPPPAKLLRTGERVQTVIGAMASRPHCHRVEVGKAARSPSGIASASSESPAHGMTAAVNDTAENDHEEEAIQERIALARIDSEAAERAGRNATRRGPEPPRLQRPMPTSPTCRYYAKQRWYACRSGHFRQPATTSSPSFAMANATVEWNVCPRSSRNRGTWPSRLIGQRWRRARIWHNGKPERMQ